MAEGDRLPGWRAGMNISFVILAHQESQDLASSLSQALHKLAGTTLIAHALRKVKASWNPVVVVANLRNVESIEKIAKETLPEQVVIAECPDTASVLQAVTTGLACLEDDLQGCVFVMPLNMPLLEMTDTLASMERMLLLRVAHAQVPYVGLLNRSATRHPPVFCGEAQWLMDLGRFLDLPREEQEGSDPRVKSIRKAIGPAYIDRPEKLLLRLCTVGYSVCAARESDMITVDSEAEFVEAERVLQSRLVTSHQAAGVTFQDPCHTFLSMDTQIGKDTEIGVSVQCYGKVEIGPNCRIEGPTWIRDSTLEEGAHVRSHSVLEETHVEKNAGIGPFACLGGGLHIGTNAKIGSFVRAANAIVGNDSLAHPLAAIEDVEVGPGTRIGAGTVVRQDGPGKNNIEIDESTFIGARSTIAAPVRVGSEAVIAAGSVVTHDVPSGALVFGRAKQEFRRDSIPT